ncbi:kinesin-like protein CG14535 [Diorhabda carinulata]|uniref:kinesin-like protein CG14535 n=1 Tax=Diorhabda carinulata TaxID=1163345 RepID=UPI0025A17838|nr:kinesin-like protein CG14535 [Diorhabda carinulata]
MASATDAARDGRMTQKTNVCSSPHRRKRYSSEGADESGFAGTIQRTPPPVPPALIRRIGVREVTGLGKVKVMLRVSNPTSLGPGVDSRSFNGFFSIDKRKKQVTLTDPSLCNGSVAPEDRRVGVAAPKMFAFDAIFSQDDSQTEICSSALTDVVHAVINGTDGCLFCFGQAGLGKSYTMIGSPENANTPGIIPCAISWLFKGINEQRQKTGARFSVRVSAVEICGPTNQLKDLLAGYANDSEQSPGMYLRDDHLFGNQPPHCELRVPSAERAAHYLDAAIDCRSCHREDSRDSHFLFTLHVYQYSVAGKGGVAGGRSRLHLIDLGNSDRGKSSGGIPLSGVGNIILAIFNGQKHLPYKEHKLTRLLKECLGSVTCHATMIAHVSPLASNYLDTLTTVQLASRIHRMRRKRIKFVSTATGNGSGGSSGEDGSKTAGTSSEPDPSSSDLSADTVIYVGRADDATDGEHPPVYIPSLNSGDNRCSMSKALRGSIAEEKPQSSKLIKSEDKVIQSRNISRNNSNYKSSPSHNCSTKFSPSRKDAAKVRTDLPKYSKNECSDEQWIDGPRVSKSKVVEAFHLMKEKCHIRKCETWIDGPMKEDGSSSYGYMDSHKKNMIRKWVEHQTIQIQKSRHVIPRASHVKLKESVKELTQFKSSEHTNGVDEDMKSIRPDNLKQIDTQEIPKSPSIPPAIEEDGEDEDEPKLPPALPLIQPLSSREVSLESLDQILKDRMISNAEYNSYQKLAYEEANGQEEILEIIEVEEPLEPVPTQDSCLQVTEEDIALCMGYMENPLPEDDQESPFDHPLRILSQENLTAISNLTDSMSALSDLERILPRYHLDTNGYFNDYEDVDNPISYTIEDPSNKLNQLTRLHELYSNELSKARVGHLDSSRCSTNDKFLTRCESLTLADMLFGSEKERNDDGSIYSEPVYVQQKFCENCKINMCGQTASQNWHMDGSFFSSTQNIYEKSQLDSGGGFQKYNHNHHDNLSNLRHPDGASNPNLREEISSRLPENGTSCSIATDFITSQSSPPPNSLPSETGIAAIKLSRNQGDGGQKLEEYDSGHDSTPRTSKHSPAAISRRAESGYDSIVRDSESSSIDSDQSRIIHNRRGKCKHKHDKSFCSWFLNPFTCKHFDEPPETHF